MICVNFVSMKKKESNSFKSFQREKKLTQVLTEYYSLKKLVEQKKKIDILQDMKKQMQEAKFFFESIKNIERQLTSVYKQVVNKKQMM